MRPLIVGMGDCQVTSDPERQLVTYALGSCIAVAIYDPAVRVAGMLHLMLPDSSIGGAQGADRPYKFADTGLPLMFHRAYALGADKRRMTVRVAGGAQVMDDRGVFDIGRRNYLAARKILWKAGVLIHGEAVGGTASRTIRLDVATGAMWLRGAGGIEQEFGAPSPGPKGIGYGVPRSDRG